MSLSEENVNALLEDERLSKSEVEYICDFLSIDIDTVVYDLSSFKRNSAILLALYYSDMVDRDNKLSMRVSRVNYIYDLMDVLREECYDMVDVINLIKLYKCKIIDLRSIIYDRVEGGLAAKVQKIARAYKIKLDESNKEDFSSIAKQLLFEALEIVKPGTDNEILSNIDKYVNEKLRESMKKQREINLHECSPLDIGLTNEVLRKIEDEKSLISDLDCEFGEKMEQFVSKLNSAEQEFIALRFKGNYSRKQLAELYGKSIAAISEKEKRILNKLRKFMAN